MADTAAVRRAFLVAGTSYMMACGIGPVTNVWGIARGFWDYLKEWYDYLFGLGEPLKDAAKAAAAAIASALEAVGLNAIASLFRGANQIIDNLWERLDGARYQLLGAILIYVLYVIFLRRR